MVGQVLATLADTVMSYRSHLSQYLNRTNRIERARAHAIVSIIDRVRFMAERLEGISKKYINIKQSRYKYQAYFHSLSD